jgi:GGDEF domain-containing protein
MGTTSASGYRIERGDVLLSVQVLLTREEEQARRASGPAAATRPPHPHPQTQLPLRAVPRDARLTVKVPEVGARPATVPSSIAAAARRVASLPAPKAAIVTVDPSTGAGTLQALRRDLANEVGRPRTGRVLGVVAVDGLDQVRLTEGSGAAEEVLKAIVQVAPFALEARDRVYRVGRDQLVVMLGNAVEEDLEPARARLESAARRYLGERGTGPVSLSVRALDPERLARSTATPAARAS